MKKSIDTKPALYPTPVTVIGTMNGGKSTWTLAAHIGIIGHDRILVSRIFINHLIASRIKPCCQMLAIKKISLRQKNLKCVASTVGCGDVSAKLTDRPASLHFPSLINFLSDFAFLAKLKATPHKARLTALH